MTGLTALFEQTLVRIVLPMTANTTACGVRKMLCLVAGLALDIAVLTEQREAREIVIKERCVFPNGLIMAIVALRTQGAVVRIVVQVTRITIRR